MTLRSRLEAERASDLADPALAAALRDILALLGRSGALERALAPGDPFPDFLLPDSAGALVDRARLLAGGAFVLAFLRGGWCPYCAMTLEALAEAAPALRARGVRMAVATPETGGHAEDLRAARAAGADLTVLVDVDSGLAAACGVLFRVPESYAAMLAAEGVDLASRQGNAARVLPVPATFVVGADGRVRWRHVDADFSRRAEPAEILAALDGASGPPSAP